MRLTPFDGVAGIAIATGLVLLDRGTPGRGQQGGIHQRAGLQDQSLLLQLPVDQHQQLLVQTIFAQPFAKVHQRRFIGHRVLQAQTDKTPPAQTVPDQFLALWVRQPVAMLEQTHLEQGQGRARRSARRRRIHRLQRPFDGFPVQRPIQFVQKVVGGSRWHQTVQKSVLRIGRRLHVFQTPFQSPCSNAFFRGLSFCGTSY